MDLLKQIDDVSVDCIVIDPPYYKVMVNGIKGKFIDEKYEWDNQWKDFNDYLKWCRDWLNEIRRILKPNGSLYIFGDEKIISYIQILCEKLGFYLENHIVWMKTNNVSIILWREQRLYSSITERILFFSKHEKERMNRTFKQDKCYTDVWDYKTTTTTETVYHPTQKPIELIKRIIKTSTNEGDLVLDFFMGSGTTAVACEQLKRNWIGSEMDKKYIEIIKQRLQQKYI